MVDDEEKPTCDQLRSGQKHAIRSRVIAVKRMTKRERRRLALAVPEASEPYWRPLTRGDCEGVPRPCPFVACRHNLFLDIQSSTGGIKLNFPDREPDEMVDSCALDIAEEGGVTLERCGAAMSVTRERVRQIEERALAKVDAASPELAELVSGWAHPKGFSDAGG